MNPEFLNQNIFGNTVETYLWVTGIILIGLIFKKLISAFLSWCLFKIFKKYVSGAGLKEFQQLLNKPFSIFVTLLIFFIAFNRLEFPHEWNLAPVEKPGLRMTIFMVFEISLIISITWILLRIIDFLGLILLNRSLLTSTKLDDQFVPYFKSILKFLIIIFSFFTILGAVFQINVVALVGGLGLGGLAFALAGKETAENLLGSFTIFLDKPFTVGDQVKFDRIEGTIERIGLRSTLIRTLERSLVAVPNKKLIDTELENVTLKTIHRARFNIMLMQDTPSEKIKNIIIEIREFLINHKMVRENPVIKFNGFGNQSFDILIIYFVMTSEWEKFLEVREEVNFKIIEIVKLHDCYFANLAANQTLPINKS